MRILLVIFLAAMALPAQAQPETNINWRSVRQKQWVCRDWGGCGYEWRWRRVRTEYPNHTYRLPPGETYAYRSQDEPGWSRRDPQSERGVSCKEATIRVVGGKHLTEAGAIKDAVGRWESSIGYDFGEKFMSMTNARHYRFRCDKASTNETTAGRVGEAIAGALTAGTAEAFYKRCVVIAMPCMEPLERGDRDKR